jgi:hypothetical protein
VIKDADDLKKAKKAAAAIESLIWKHCTVESYKRIRASRPQERRWGQCN